MDDAAVWLEEFPRDELLDQFNWYFHIASEVILDVVVQEGADFVGRGDAGVVDKDVELSVEIALDDICDLFR